MKTKIITALRWAASVLWPFIFLIVWTSITEVLTPIFLRSVMAITDENSAFSIMAMMLNPVASLLWVAGAYTIAPSHKIKTASISYAIGAALATYITFFIVPADIAPNVFLRYAPFVLSVTAGAALLFFLHKKRM